MIIHGDCLEVMAAMEPESVDAIVTDPPYGLEFMGKEWDKLDWRDGGGFSKPGIGDRPTAWTSFGGNTANATCATCGGRMRGARKCDCAEPDWRVKGAAMTSRAADRAAGMQAFHAGWAEAAYRVAKPSAYLLAFGGTRTVHRMTVALEDAGWIIRDMLVWAYASGFPKSKASLKPAWEPIVMARKPGPLRMLAIDACRLPAEGAPEPQVRPTTDVDGASWSKGEHVPFHYSRKGEASASRRYASEPGDFAAFPGARGGDPSGRWPANVILTDPIFDGGWDGVVGGGYQESTSTPGSWAPRGASPIDNPEPTIYGDSGTYSRFFLVPKADRTDREPVLGGLPERVLSVWGGDEDDLTPGKKSTIARRNHHPTVKPVDLMRHLVRLVTPPGGTVLDPFLGSGTTGLACELEGFAWIGIEKEAEYVAIAEARLNGTQRGMGLVG